jgi:hypothetical protein
LVGITSILEIVFFIIGVNLIRIVKIVFKISSYS